MTIWPEPRGTLTPNRPLSDLTWLRVGGPAEMFFQPADLSDLAEFLCALPADVPVFPMGVGSNLIVRDGGLSGVVIRLGRAFAGIEIEGELVRAGAAALDAHVARKAAAEGRDLTFLRTIPGTIGGAVTMNAGCYGTYVADQLVEVEVVSREGEIKRLSADELGLAYRSSSLPEGWVLTQAVFKAPGGDAKALADRMDDQLARRDATQPTKERTAGSTFRNPAGYSSTGRDDDTHELKAWTLIDKAGFRGKPHGAAVMNEKHPNFLTNLGGASAKELEDLGEAVRKAVYEQSGITLEWEIMRVGKSARVTEAKD